MSLDKDITNPTQIPDQKFTNNPSNLQFLAHTSIIEYISVSLSDMLLVSNHYAGTC